MSNQSQIKKHSLTSLVHKDKTSVADVEVTKLGNLTIETVKKVMPSNLSSAITQEFVDTLNAVSTCQDEAELIRENFLSYTSVLQDGRFKTEDYLSAVKYVSYKLMGMPNDQAYIKTFPDRYQRLVSINTSKKDIASFVSAYAKNKLVNRILEQSLVPTWLLNQDIYQKAINVQADLMVNSQSEKIRCEAANSILTHLQKPKEAGPLVNIDMRESSGLQDLKSTLASLAQQQLSLINQGVTAKDIAEQRIVESN